MEVAILKNAECVALTAADLVAELLNNRPSAVLGLAIGKVYAKYKNAGRDCHQTPGKQQQFWNSNDLMGLQHADQYQRRPEYLFYTDKCHARLH